MSVARSSWGNDMSAYMVVGTGGCHSTNTMARMMICLRNQAQLAGKAALRLQSTPEKIPATASWQPSRCSSGTEPWTPATWAWGLQLCSGMAFLGGLGAHMEPPGSSCGDKVAGSACGFARGWVEIVWHL